MGHHYQNNQLTGVYLNKGRIRKLCRLIKNSYRGSGSTLTVRIFRIVLWETTIPQRYEYRTSIKSDQANMACVDDGTCAILGIEPCNDKAHPCLDGNLGQVHFPGYLLIRLTIGNVFKDGNVTFR